MLSMEASCSLLDWEWEKNEQALNGKQAFSCEAKETQKELTTSRISQHSTAVCQQRNGCEFRFCWRDKVSLLRARGHQAATPTHKHRMSPVRCTHSLAPHLWARAPGKCDARDRVSDNNTTFIIRTPIGDREASRDSQQHTEKQPPSREAFCIYDLSSRLLLCNYIATQRERRDTRAATNSQHQLHMGAFTWSSVRVIDRKGLRECMK